MNGNNLKKKISMATTIFSHSRSEQFWKQNTDSILNLGSSAGVRWFPPSSDQHAKYTITDLFLSRKDNQNRISECFLVYRK